MTVTSLLSVHHRKPRSDRGVAAWISIPAVLLLIFVTVAYVFGTVVTAGSLGIRQVMYGPAQGFSARALAPGYHWSLPSYSKVHVFPAALRILNLHSESLKKDAKPSATRTFLAPIEIQTKDGATVDTDFTILNRLYPSVGKDGGIDHGGPVELINNVGLTPQAWDQRIRSVVDDELKRSLGKLSAANFYDPVERRPLEEVAFKASKERLAPFGIKVEAVLLRRFTYRSKRIDEAIFEKNLQEVDERLNAAASLLAEERANLEDVAAELDARIETLRVDGTNRAKILRSEGDLTEAELIAQGDLAVAEARANVDRLRAEVLAQNAASSTYVARELAPLLESLRGGIVTGIDPYDLEQWMKRFGVSEEQR